MVFLVSLALLFLMTRVHTTRMVRSRTTRARPSNTDSPITTGEAAWNRVRSLKLL